MPIDSARCALMLLLASLLGSGCSLIAPAANPADMGVEQAAPTGELVSLDADPEGLNAVGAAMPSERVSLPAGNRIGMPEVEILASYAAASGRECRRVRKASGTRMRVICRHADGAWRAARALDGTRESDRMPAPPSSSEVLAPCCEP